MRYLLLIYHSEAANAEMSESEGQALMQAYWAFNEEAQKAGVLVGGDALHPTAAATTVRVRSGQTLTTDGPFAETKEQLGGYYMLDCENLDQAIEFAAKIPDVHNGSVEIRPVYEFG
ncbi:MAG: YciI family protein [Anaerolineales bacterium]|nr:YciI family protein [Anaerolineales bacterium]